MTEAPSSVKCRLVAGTLDPISRRTRGMAARDATNRSRMVGATGIEPVTPRV